MSVRLPPIRPTLIDRALGYFSPATAVRRIQARAALELVAPSASSGAPWTASAAWQGASRARRALQGWAAGAGSANADTVLDLPALRARSRDLLRNAPLAEGAVSTLETNVIGTGMTPRPTINRRRLGLDDKAAEEFETGAAELFGMWAASKDCDLTRSQSFEELQALAFRSTLENGDALMVERFRQRAGSPWGFCLQLIEGDRLCNPNFGPDRADMVAGVELDDDGAPKSYHVSSRHPGDMLLGSTGMTWAALPAFSPTSGRRMVHHLYARKRIDQARGLPLLAPVIEPFRQLAKYSEAEMMAAVINACFAMSFKSPTGDLGAGLEREAPVGGSGADRAHTEVGIIEPGTQVDLQPDEEIAPIQAGRPNAEFGPFTNAILRQIGVGLGVPFEIVVMHFEASYSASRGAIELLWQTVTRRQAWTARNICQPAYEGVLGEAIARGWLHAPGYFEDPFIRQAYNRAAWVAATKPQLDPVKEATAAEKWIALGVKSVDRVAREVTGETFGAVHVQRVREHAERVEAGLEPAVAGAAAAPASTAAGGDAAGVDPAKDPDMTTDGPDGQGGEDGTD